jgi:hypothetical protein
MSWSKSEGEIVLKSLLIVGAEPVAVDNDLINATA